MSNLRIKSIIAGVTMLFSTVATKAEPKVTKAMPRISKEAMVSVDTFVKEGKNVLLKTTKSGMEAVDSTTMEKISLKETKKITKEVNKKISKYNLPTGMLSELKKAEGKGLQEVLPNLSKRQYRFISRYLKAMDINPDSIRLNEKQLDVINGQIKLNSQGESLSKLTSIQEKIISDTNLNANKVKPLISKEEADSIKIISKNGENLTDTLYKIAPDAISHRGIDLFAIERAHYNLTNEIALPEDVLLKLKSNKDTTYIQKLIPDANKKQYEFISELKELDIYDSYTVRPLSEEGVKWVGEQLTKNQKLKVLDEFLSSDSSNYRVEIMSGNVIDKYTIEANGCFTLTHKGEQLKASEKLTPLQPLIKKQNSSVSTPPTIAKTEVLKQRSVSTKKDLRKATSVQKEKNTVVAGNNKHVESFASANVNKVEETAPNKSIVDTVSSTTITDSAKASFKDTTNNRVETSKMNTADKKQNIKEQTIVKKEIDKSKDMQKRQAQEAAKNLALVLSGGGLTLLGQRLIRRKNKNI